MALWRSEGLSHVQVYTKVMRRPTRGMRRSDRLHPGWRRNSPRIAPARIAFSDFVRVNACNAPSGEKKDGQECRGRIAARGRDKDVC